MLNVVVHIRLLLRLDYDISAHCGVDHKTLTKIADLTNLIKGYTESVDVTVICSQASVI